MDIKHASGALKTTHIDPNPLGQQGKLKATAINLV
jgi:hypothetical protein